MDLDHIGLCSMRHLRASTAASWPRSAAAISISFAPFALQAFATCEPRHTRLRPAARLEHHLAISSEAASLLCSGPCLLHVRLHVKSGPMRQA